MDAPPFVCKGGVFRLELPFAPATSFDASFIETLRLAYAFLMRGGIAF